MFFESPSNRTIENLDRLTVLVIRDGHGNGNGLGFPYLLPLLPGILRMGMEIFTKALFPRFPGIFGITMSFIVNPDFP